MAFTLQVLYCLDLAYKRYADISASKEKDPSKFIENFGARFKSDISYLTGSLIDTGFALHSLTKETSINDLH